MSFRYRGDLVRHVSALLLAIVTFVTGATSQATPAPTQTASAAIYLEIANTGSEPDRLIGGSVDFATSVEIRTWQSVDGIQTSTTLPDGLELPAGITMLLQPGANQLQLVGLTQDLTDGSTFDLKLQFESAGEVTITVSVQANPPTGGEPVVSGSLAIANAWARPVAASDNCGCSIPDSARQWIPSATPTDSEGR